MCICVYLFGVLLVVVESRKGQVKLIVVEVVVQLRFCLIVSIFFFI